MTRSGPEVAAARKAAAARVLNERMDAHGISRPLIAAQLGVSKSLVQSWCDADDDCAMPLAHLGSIECEGLKLDLVERTLGPGYSVVRTETDGQTLDLGAVAQLAARSGELIADLVTACADGTIDRAEAVELQRELQPHMRALSALMIALKSAEQTLGTSVKKGRK